MIITKKDLPLPESGRNKLREFCEGAQEDGRLTVISDIPRRLRRDYIDASLPLPKRAVSHINVSPGSWRKAMTYACSHVVRNVFQEKRIRKVGVVYPWRAGLLFARAFAKIKEVKHFHMGMRRDEHNPHQTAEVWLEPDLTRLDSCRGGTIVADPMLATGGSLRTVMETILSAGICETRVVLVAVISAPEGIYNLLNLFPAVRIVTMALDSHLDESGFIQPGLGDAGDKFFSGIKTSYFRSIRNIFNKKEWEELERRIQMANGQ